MTERAPPVFDAGGVQPLALDWGARLGRASRVSDFILEVPMFTPAVPLSRSVTLYFDGSPVQARLGESVAACLLRAGVTAFRVTPVSGAPRLPYCMIGQCFDCLVEIEGQGSRQACLAVVQAGMRVWPQDGAARIPGADDAV